MTKPTHPMAKYKDDGNCCNEEIEKQLKTLVKQMLIHQTFEAIYQERRWNDNLNAYRDLVVVSKEGNEIFLNDLEFVRSRLMDHYKGSKWIGITPPSLIGAPAAGYSLWLNLQNTAIGKHKFRVRKVKFNDTEILLEVKSVSEIDNLSTSTSSESCHSPNASRAGDSERDVIGEAACPLDLDATLSALQQQWTWFRALLTAHNIIEASRFLTVLIVFLFTGLFKMTFNLGDFTLKLLDRLIYLIKVLMPLMLSIIDLIKKIIGGFYITVVHMWNSYHNQGARGYPMQQPRAIQFDGRPYQQYKHYQQSRYHNR